MTAEDEVIAAEARVFDGRGLSVTVRRVPLAAGGYASVSSGGGRGDAVLLVNGLGTPAAMFAPLAARLGDHAWHAVDLPGFGRSDPPALPLRDYRSRAVQFLEDVLDALALDRVTVIANSLGSLWSTWLALDRPHRVHALCHLGCPALVLGTSAPLPMRLLSIRPLGRILLRLRPPSAAQVEDLSRMVGEHPLDEDIAALLLATERLPGFAATFRASLHQLLRLRGARREHVLGPGDLGRLDRPTLLVWGEHDPFGAVAVGQTMVDLLPDARLHVVAGGHAPWLGQADAVAAVVRPFLAAVGTNDAPPHRG